MSHLIRPRTLGSFGLFALLACGILACQEGSTGDPLGVLFAGEGSGLSLDPGIPSLPVLLSGRGPEAAGGSDRADEWTGRWEASWLMEPERGRAVREEIYDEAVPSLARSLGAEGVRAAVDGLGRSLADAGDPAPSGLPPLVSGEVDSAGSRLSVAKDDLDGGDLAHALRAALEGTDHLWSVSPRTAARSMLDRARSAVKGGALSSLSPADRERVERLVVGAESAVSSGDYPRAIRRAYYALGLLAGR